MLALLAGPVSDLAERTLALDGWLTRRVAVLPNPGRGPQPSGYPPRFWAVYTKLEVFALEQYQRGGRPCRCAERCQPGLWGCCRGRRRGCAAGAERRPGW
jgi:hypothetical protein